MQRDITIPKIAASWFGTTMFVTMAVGFAFGASWGLGIAATILLSTVGGLAGAIATRKYYGRTI